VTMRKPFLSSAGARRLARSPARALAVLLLAAVPALASAQADWPSQPVKLVVAFPPGGSTDITARLIAPKLSQAWGQPVIVENRPGAGANIGTAHVARSAPDGQTILVATTAIAISPGVYANTGYDALADFA